jgi:hypothetical protein
MAKSSGFGGRGGLASGEPHMDSDILLLVGVRLSLA